MGVRSGGRKDLARLPLKKERMELSQLPREALVWAVSLKKHLIEGTILAVQDDPTTCVIGSNFLTSQSLSLPLWENEIGIQVHHEGLFGVSMWQLLA